MRAMHLLSTFTTIIIVLFCLNVVPYSDTHPKEEIFERCPKVAQFPLLNETDSDIGISIKQGKYIVNGTKEDIKNFPFTVQLWNATARQIPQFICGATIISERFVLSAAHCVNQTFTYFILAGSSELFSGQRYDLEKPYYIHPEYSFLTTHADFAVLKTTIKITYRDTIKTVKLPSPYEEIGPGTETKALGWGLLQEGSSNLSLVLMSVKVPILSDKNCKRAYPNQISKYMICAGYKDGMKDACASDSGGPLEINGKIVGITSWAIGCARPNCPGVYAKVSEVMDWITKIIGTQI